MKAIILVACGGAVGAVLRYAIGVWSRELFGPEYPWGTFFVNVLGCLLMGVLVQLIDVAIASDQARLLIGVGLLGALTTFSTFGYDTVICVRQLGWTLALANVAANVVCGLFAVVLGMALVRWLVSANSLT